MSKDYTTIRVEKDAKAAADDARTDEETWSDYLRRCTENPPETREFVDLSSVRDGPDAQEVTLEASERRKLAEEIAGELR